MKNNKEAVQLLLNDPKALIAAYQNIIEIVVTKFVRRGFFSDDEKMDIVQKINESLLERKVYNIQRNYNGSVLLSTYFSKVVYNQCLEITRSRKNKTRVESETLLVNQADSSLNAEDKLLIQDEINRLGIILKYVIKCSFRLFIALKLYARIPLSIKDLDEVMPVENHLFRNFKDLFFKAYDHFNDKEVYTRAIPFLNSLTGKSTDWDSMRKWLNIQIDKLIELQNGDPPRSGHNRETIRILLAKYFEAEAEK